MKNILIISIMLTAFHLQPALCRLNLEQLAPGLYTYREPGADHDSFFLVEDRSKADNEFIDLDAKPLPPEYLLLVLAAGGAAAGGTAGGGTAGGGTAAAGADAAGAAAAGAAAGRTAGGGAAAGGAAAGGAAAGEPAAGRTTTGATGAAGRTAGGGTAPVRNASNKSNGISTASSKWKWFTSPTPLSSNKALSAGGKMLKSAGPGLIFAGKTLGNAAVKALQELGNAGYAVSGGPGGGSYMPQYSSGYSAPAIWGGSYNGAMGTTSQAFNPQRCNPVFFPMSRTSGLPMPMMPFGSGYTMYTPGELPTTVSRFGSGWTVNTPGELPTTINRFGSGYTINTPGELPTTVSRFGSGWTVNTPGELPTSINRFGSGYTINTPGEPPTMVTPFGNGWTSNTPGFLPTTITPFGNGYSVNSPGELPQMITPFGRCWNVFP